MKDGGTKRVWHVYTTQRYSASGKDETLSFVTLGMLREIIQAQTDQHTATPEEAEGTGLKGSNTGYYEK